MADSKDQKETQSDLEVFRLPPRDLLEKYSQGEKIEAPKPEPETTPQKKISPSVSSTSYPASPPPSTPPPSQGVRKDITVSSGPPQQPPRTPQKLPSEELPPQGFPSKSSGGKGWLILGGVLGLLAVLVGLVVAEWWGLISLGISRLVGPPPASLIWSKTNPDVFSSFQGNFVLVARLRFEDNPLKSWVESKDQKRLAWTFEGSVVGEKGRLQGTLQSPPFLASLYEEFLFDGGVLYLRQGESWYSYKLAPEGIERVMEAIPELLAEPKNFQRLSAENGLWWYRLRNTNFFPEDRYLGCTVEDVRIAIRPKDKTFAGLKIRSACVGVEEMTFLLFDIQKGYTSIAKLPSSPKPLEQKSPLFTEFWQKLASREFAGGWVGPEESAEVIAQRDQKRKNDLRRLAKALDAYYQDHGEYPKTTRKEKVEEYKPLQEALLPYLEEDKWQIADPQYPDYYYAYISDGENYELSARLEDESDPSAVPIGDSLVLFFVTSSQSYNPTQSGNI
ncbi:hypothetical protein J7L13_02720 [bacterium]|nr:hypothetical protein [bacterium]